MIHRTFVFVVIAVFATGCHLFETQTSPTETETVSLSGVVRAAGSTAGVKGAVVLILDGPNKGLSMATDNKGGYRFDNLAAGDANVSASASEMPEAIAGVHIDRGSTLDFQLEPPPWSARGSGSDVFEVPAWVSRVRITGEVPAGRCDTLVIRLAGASILNTTLGTCNSVVGIRRYEGVHLMAGGGMAEIFVPSLSVNWTIEWIR
jgi:hypothetical protein